MPLWTVEESDGVVVASYANPPRNYLTSAGTAELSARIDEWRRPGVRVVILTGGVPDRFITHYSVEELLELASDREELARRGPGANRGYHGMLRRLRDLPIPVIAAMSGDTMGGGFEISLACDIRIAARGDHRYGLPEATLGILPGGTGTQRLARLLGAGRAIEFVLRGRICRPREALDLGLVHELAEDAAARARIVAAELAQRSPVALAQIKRAVYQGSEMHLEAGLEIESDAFLRTMESAEAVRAMRAYVSVPVDERRDWLEARTTPPEG